MTGREKIEAAFSSAGTPEIPVALCYEGIYIRDHADQFPPCPWWYPRSPDIEQQVQWHSAVIEATGQDWFVLPGCPPRDERAAQRIELAGGAPVLVDDRTGRRLPVERPAISGWHGTGGHSHHPERPPADEAEVDAIIGVDGSFDSRRPLEEGRWDLAARLLAVFGRTHFPMGYVASPLWCCYGLWGFEGMMTMMLDRPGLVRHACERFLQRCGRMLQTQALAGAAGVWIEECMTDMVSPAAFESFNLPYLRRLVDMARACALKSVYYYCGNPGDRWDLLLAAGADALSLEESKKGWEVDIDEVVSRARGRCAVLGNLDAMGLLRAGSAGALAAEIRRQVSAGRRNGSRFIMGIGSPVTPETPVARVRLFCDLVRELGGVPQ